MRRSSGVAFISIGLGIAIYALAGPPETGSVESRNNPATIAARPDAQIQVNVSPTAPPVRTSTTSSDLRPTTDSIERAPAAPPVASAASVPQPRAPKAPAARAVVVAKAGTRTPVGQPAASQPHLDQAALTREVQRQLQRVGCYAGGISGTWTPSTRRAMKEFTERVNATLPIDRPDDILLAMLQNQDGKVCGLGCPAGQSMVDNGLCLPTTVFAESAAKRPATARAQPAAPVPDTGVPSAAETSLPTADVAEDANLPGRMALAGPKQGTDVALPPLGPQLVQPGTDLRNDPARPSTRPAAPAKYVPNSRRKMGSWIFYDAPVDRVLGR